MCTVENRIENLLKIKASTQILAETNGVQVHKIIVTVNHRAIRHPQFSAGEKKNFAENYVC